MQLECTGNSKYKLKTRMHRVDRTRVSQCWKRSCFFTNAR